MYDLETWNKKVSEKTDQRLRVINVDRKRIGDVTKTLLEVECTKHPGTTQILDRSTLLSSRNVVKCDKCLKEITKNMGYRKTFNAIQKQIKRWEERIDFSLLPDERLDKHTRYDLICKIHNVKYQTTFELLQKGHPGCPICRRNLIKSITVLPNKVFISRLQDMYGDRFDLSRVKYDGRLKRIELKCNKHNKWFKAFPGNTLKKNFQGCPKCHLEYLVNFKTETLDHFLQKSKERHGDRYDYSKVKYKASFLPVKIICKQHGPFYQIPSLHYRGSGCPNCNSSIGEHCIQTILANCGIHFIREYRLSRNYKYRYDFYLPDYDILIEYHGAQHYEYLPFFYKTKQEFISRQNVDKFKEKLASKYGMKLITIPYKQFKILDKYLFYRLSKFYKFYFNGKLYKSALEISKEYNLPYDFDLRSLSKYKTTHALENLKNRYVPILRN